MRRNTALLLMALGAGLAGCAGQDAGGVTEGLTAVNPADYENVVRFYDPLVSARPLTTDEIGDASSAYPVTMTFGQKYAVAWAVIDGVPQVGNGNAVLGVWHIFSTPDAHPIDGALRPGETPVVTEPDVGGDAPHSAGPADVGGSPLLGSLDGRLQRAVDVRGVGTATRGGIVYLSWLDSASDEYRDIFANPNIHRGCL